MLAYNTSRNENVIMIAKQSKLMSLYIIYIIRKYEYVIAVSITVINR